MIIVATLLIISAVVYIIARALTKYYTVNYTDNYPELYVSKGSDDHISDISKMVEVPQQETLYTKEEVIEFGEMIAWNMVGKTITESFIRTVSKELFKQFKKN